MIVSKVGGYTFALRCAVHTYDPHIVPQKAWKYGRREIGRISAYEPFSSFYKDYGWVGDHKGTTVPLNNMIVSKIDVLQMYPPKAWKYGRREIGRISANEPYHSPISKTTDE